MKKHFLQSTILGFIALASTISSPATANVPVKNITEIVTKCHEFKFTKAQCAYVLATAEHETAYTFQPVKEAYWLSENWRLNNLRYAPFYGRGYIQLTWKLNYYKMGKKLNIDLVKNPDKALDKETSLNIMFTGLRDGDFTGYRLSQFVINSLTYARQARLTVNALDKADQIARRAHFWYSRLTVY